MPWTTLAPLVLILLGLSCHTATAQWAVEDLANIYQSSLTAINTFNQVQNSAAQIINEYNILRNQIVQIAHQVENLQRIPKGLNFLDDIKLFGSKLDGLLSQANAVSFQLDQATRDFDRVYRKAATIASTSDILTVRKQLLDARMQASGMSVQMTAVQGNIGDIYTRLCNLLNGSVGASGNLDHQQIEAQKQALLLHSQQVAQAMLASQARLQAQIAAERTVIEQLEITRIEEFTAPIPGAGTYEGQGKLPTYRWMN